VVTKEQQVLLLEQVKYADVKRELGIYGPLTTQTGDGGPSDGCNMALMSDWAIEEEQESLDVPTGEMSGDKH
jgi:hypothetical protein